METGKGKNMELLQLQYFAEVAKCGKISTAAKKLFISAPSLSATIARLEKELGTQLFTRTGNTITLNREGEIFLRYVREALSALENGKAELKIYGENSRHHVKIAATTSNLWISLLSAFSYEYPDITISNTSLKLSQMPDASIYPQYNFLLIEEKDFPERESYKSTLLIKNDPPVVVVPHDHYLAGQKTVDLREIREENFLLPVADMSLHRMAEELLTGAGVSKENLSECSYMLRRRMVAEHRGIAFSTLSTSRSEDQTMCYIPISYPSAPQNHYIVWDRGRDLNEDEKAFLLFAEEYLS